MENSSDEFILGLESSSSSDSFQTDKDKASRTCLQVQEVDMCNVQDDTKLNSDIIISPEVLLFYSDTSDDENSDYSRSYSPVYNNTVKVPADTDSEPNIHNSKATFTDQIKCKSKQKLFSSGDKTSKKRKPEPQNWKKNKAALLREKGEAYKSYSGKDIPKKTPNLGMLCKEACPFKCNVKFSKEQREKLFYDFYKLDVNGKNALLYNCISEVNVKRKRKGANKHKSSSFVYMVKNECETVRVCKTALAAIFNIGRGKIDHIQKSKKAGLDAPPLDCRGKHMTRPHKIAEEVVDYIKNHIRSFLCQESHHSQTENEQHTKYSSRFPSLKRMHHIYLDEVRTNGKPEYFNVSEITYRQIFHSNFNLSSCHPRSDICSFSEQREIDEISIKPL